MNEQLLTLIKENSALVDDCIVNHFSVNKCELTDMMEYSIFAGGKRIRPFIVIESFKLFSKNDNAKPCVPLACALEMIHTYSLIHDDLPCMDNDDFRRGMPTSHKKFGEANALLAGDSLLTHAFDMATEAEISSSAVVKAIKVLSNKSGYPGMIGGQFIDLDAKNRVNSFDDIYMMHTMKTGALISCAAILGYIASCKSDFDERIIKDLDRFGTCIGVAFQLRDDILDVISTEDKLGKPIGSDSKNEKTTSLSFLSIDQAQKMVEDLTREAIDIIIKYKNEFNGTDALIQLADYLVGRDK